MEYLEAGLREVAPSSVPDDDPARFLRELRQLRNGAGLEHVQLAARAHYPCDAILAAEAGPALPDLPVLSAYVRGCGGTVTEWEERWRTLTRSPALTLLPTRDAGGSDAAAAGARIGSVSLAADAHDPAIIMAALGRVASGIASEPSPKRSLFTPAASAAPVAASVRSSVAASAAASVFAVDSAPAPSPEPVPAVAAVPDARRGPRSCHRAQHSYGRRRTSRAETLFDTSKPAPEGRPRSLTPGAPCRPSRSSRSRSSCARLRALGAVLLGARQRLNELLGTLTGFSRAVPSMIRS